MQAQVQVRVQAGQKRAVHRLGPALAQGPADLREQARWTAGG